MPVIVVAAVARNGVIGRHGALPWHLPEDLRRFKALTMSHILVMGRKTFESIGRPLPGRTTIVVTRQTDWPAPEGVLVAPSVEAALQQAAALDDDVFVVGGAEIYRQALARADVLELTELDSDADGDVHFPEVDWSTWTETSRIVGEGFDFVTYVRREEG